MKLVDANVLMYAAGAPHANKAKSVALLERIAAGEEEATIDVEVLQEILHRYRAIGRWADGQRVYDLARRVFPHPLAVDVAVLDCARKVMDQYPVLLARDAVHAAVVDRQSLAAIYSFDRDFDVIDGLERLEP